MKTNNTTDSKKERKVDEAVLINLRNKKDGVCLNTAASANRSDSSYSEDLIKSGGLLWFGIRTTQMTLSEFQFRMYAEVINQSGKEFLFSETTLQERKQA